VELVSEDHDDDVRQEGTRSIGACACSVELWGPSGLPAACKLQCYLELHLLELGRRGDPGSRFALQPLAG
jgi:hypothetical protein